MIRRLDNPSRAEAGALPPHPRDIYGTLKI